MKKQVEQAVSKKMVAAAVQSDQSKSQKMKDLFNMGLEIKEIASELDVRYNFVYNVISNYVNMNGIEVVSTKKAGKKEAILEMWAAGKSNKEISIELKTNYNYVFNTIKAAKAAQSEQVGEG